MIKKQKMLLLPAILLTLGCRKNNTNSPGVPSDAGCDQWRPTPGLVTITGPAAVGKGRDISLSVKMIGSNGCATEASILSIPEGNAVTLTGNVHYEGCMCTAALTEVTATFIFRPPGAGRYHFKGTGINGNIITHEVLVQ